MIDAVDGGRLVAAAEGIGLLHARWPSWLVTP